MNAASRIASLGLLLLLLLLVPVLPVHAANSVPKTIIAEWQFRWDDDPVQQRTWEELDRAGGWTTVSYSNPVPDNPTHATSAWLKIALPPPSDSGTVWKQPGLFIDKLYGHQVRIYTGDRTLYEADRHYTYDVFKLALPIEQSELGDSVYMKITTLSDRIGLHHQIEVTEYSDGVPRFYKNDFIDLMLGGSLVFFGIIMLACSSFLKKSQMTRWISLSLVILTTGTLIAAFSPFPYIFIGPYGKICITLFDLSLFIFLPALACFIEKALDSGRIVLLPLVRKLMTAYSGFCIALLIFNELSDSRYIKIYYFFTLNVLGIVMIVLFSILIGTTIKHAVKGNRDALIMSGGFALFAVTGIGELIWFFYHAKNYDLFIWKWGVLCFVVAFIVVLARRFALDHEQVVNYSKQLELYNTRLQRHEKMEILSELAASVAHEVRNPLQVTRGFLQLLRETAEGNPKTYIGYAMEELDRASAIITDYLTFAKPQLDDVTVLRLSEEFQHIEGILAPMANIQGGEVNVRLADGLYIEGNSSKLKQAFVNIVKNSIEALNGEGRVDIWAYRDNGEIVIHVKDTGIGMDENELSRLGEPYFSSKSKGTGLGLMVTFRIIEVMRGKIEFKSQKGIGTEAIVRFPAAAAD
ncbi:ATP-binding protein [Paenibacillus hodogayensis]|uniref:histidine kinase n=1 Tax=Paenibacillus hodogayensis TaxID=279208 RepID=A0ABV5W3Y1_9BACL